MGNQKQLALLLLEQLYSFDTIQICRLLIDEGAKTLLELRAETRFDFETLKNSLILLLHNNIIKYDKGKEDDQTKYYINISEVFMRMRYPKFKIIASKKLGIIQAQIISQIINVGSFSVSEAIDFLTLSSIDNKESSTQHKMKEPVINDQAKVKIARAFIHLVRNNYLERIVNFEDIQSKRDKFQQEKRKKNLKLKQENNKVKKREAKYQSKISLRSTKAKKSQAKKKGSLKKDDEEELPEELIQMLKEDDQKEQSKKSKNKQQEQEDSDEESTNKQAKPEQSQTMILELIKDPLIFDSKLQKQYNFRINSRRFIHQIRALHFIQFATERFTYHAGIIMKSIMKISRKYSKSSSSSSSQYFTPQNILQSMQDIDRSMMSVSIVTKYLQLMSQDSSQMIQMNTGAINNLGTQQFSFNFEGIVEKLKINLLDASVDETFSAYHGRVFRILRQRGYLDEKKLNEISLIDIKQMRSILGDLFVQGFLQTQEVPQQKGGAVTMYHVNLKQAFQILRERIIKEKKNQENLTQLKFEQVSEENLKLSIRKFTAFISELDDSLIMLNEF